MIDMGAAAALFMLWVGFMTVVGVYVVRIGLMLRRQRVTEREYRLRLAARRGRAVREMTGRAEA